VGAARAGGNKKGLGVKMDFRRTERGSEKIAEEVGDWKAVERSCCGLCACYAQDGKSD
jgi:hypothetical protein